MTTLNWISAGNDADDAPLAVVLHGLGDSSQGWLPAVQALAVPEYHYVLVDAPDPYFGGYSWFPIPGLSDPDAGYDDYIAGIRRSQRLLEALLAELWQQRGHGAERTVLMGFSQGCMMTVSVGLAADTPFAALIGISGRVPFIAEYPQAFGSAAASQRLLLTHGIADEMIPIVEQRAHAKRLGDLGINITWREFAKGHGLDVEEELPLLRSWLQEAAIPRS